MNASLFVLVAAVIGYLFGSIPSGLIIGKKFKKIDIREYGSKSMGTTNTGRILGKKFGLIVLFLDSIKCIVAIGISILIYRYVFQFDKEEIYYLYTILAAGGMAILGHCYPIFAHFKGGKAVATSLGFMAFTSPIIAIIGCIVFLLVLKISKIVSLSSIIAALSIAIFAYFPIFTQFNFLGLEYSIFYSIMVTFAVLLIIYRHRSNIKRMLNHSENKITWLK